MYFMGQRRHRFSRAGQGQTDYGLILIFIGIFLAATVYFFGTSNRDSIFRSADRIGGATGTTTSSGGGGF